MDLLVVQVYQVDQVQVGLVVLHLPLVLQEHQELLVTRELQDIQELRDTQEHRVPVVQDTQEHQELQVTRELQDIQELQLFQVIQVQLQDFLVILVFLDFLAILELLDNLVIPE